MAEFSLLLTRDGSPTVFHSGRQETYHSTHGAVQESMHVFIKQGLEYWCSQQVQQTVSIFEMGFGTGLNAWLAWQFAIEKNAHMQYTAVEIEPLDAFTISQLEKNLSVHQPLFHALHQATWNKLTTLDTHFSLHKINTSLQDFLPRAEKFDVIFYDVFSPNCQPELWTDEMLISVLSLLKPSGVWVTYCAKGHVKRTLKSLANQVETLPGPPGKREMLRVVRN